MTREEELLFEIKQLKQSLNLMRGVVKQQDEELKRYEKIMCDWIECQKEEIKRLTPSYE